MRTRATQSRGSNDMYFIIKYTFFVVNTRCDKVKTIRAGELMVGEGWIRSANGISELNAVCIYYKVYYQLSYTLYK